MSEREATKAAERLRQFDPAYNSAKDWFDREPNSTTARMSYRSAEMHRLKLLADLGEAVLAEHAADDELPIDEAWLESLGFTKHTGFLPSPWTVYASPSFELQFEVEKSKWTFKLHTIQAPANRDDFLELCRLLNIALKPIGQEKQS